jgi:cell wall-associated NlpC family hydrolase
MVLFCCLFVAGWAAFTPVQSQFTKIPFVISLVAIPVTLIWIWTRLCLPLATLVVVLVSPFAYPSKAVDRDGLRQAYVASLQLYLGVPYVWGGETRLGLDCSGLMRRAWESALWKEGFRTRNPALWREAVFVWWNDCSAKEIGRGYRGHVQVIGETPRLNDLSANSLQLGDLAVTGGGAHILAYLGNDLWIQADPNLVNGGDKVILTRRPSTNGWFHLRAQLRRWRLLDHSEVTASAPQRTTAPIDRAAG